MSEGNGRELLKAWAVAISRNTAYEAKATNLLTDMMTSLGRRVGEDGGRSGFIPWFDHSDAIREDMMSDTPLLTGGDHGRVLGGVAILMPDDKDAHIPFAVYEGTGGWMFAVGSRGVTRYEITLDDPKVAAHKLIDQIVNDLNTALDRWKKGDSQDRIGF